MRMLLSALAATTFLAGAAQATTVYPLDRATILAGSPFDFKVEFKSVVKPEDVKITVNGQDYKTVLGKGSEFVAEEKGKEDKILGSALILRGLTILAAAGDYKVEVSAGAETKVGDLGCLRHGETRRPRTSSSCSVTAFPSRIAPAARIMSKGMTEGKANGRLNMDDLDHMAFIGTSSTEAIATDSANTMSAYMTGHKTAVNALGVYADRTPDSWMIRRSKPSPKPASPDQEVDRHRLDGRTRGCDAGCRRCPYPQARRQGRDRRHDVRRQARMSSSAAARPISSASRPRLQAQGRQGLHQACSRKPATRLRPTRPSWTAAGTNTGKILGLFHTGNMDTTLDREFLKKGTVDKFPNQPGLVDMTKAALGEAVEEPGRLLPDGRRRQYRQDVPPARLGPRRRRNHRVRQGHRRCPRIRRSHPDTLIVVTGDHTHGVSIIGTVDDEKPGTEMREKVGTYAEAGFPNYTDENGDGYPDKVDVTPPPVPGANNGPDHYETFRPKLDGPFAPAIQNERRNTSPTKPTRTFPAPSSSQGNIPKSGDSGVHAVDDVVLQATGPGSEGFKGYMEESDVYRVLADTMALGAKQTN
jgi:alkaline phosphatase